MQQRSLFGITEQTSGVLFILIGTLTSLSPRHALSVFAPSFGVCIIFSAMTSLWFLRDHKRRIDSSAHAISIISVLISIGIGTIMLCRVGPLRVTLLFPAWVILSSLSYLINYRIFRPAGTGLFLTTMTCSAIYIVLGFVLIMNPLLGERTAHYIVCAIFICSGCIRIAIALSDLGHTGAEDTPLNLF